MTQYVPPADWVQGLRLYIVIVSTLVALVGSAQWRRWRSFLPANQLAWLALVVWNAAAWYGALDQFTHHTPGSTRTIVTALAATFTLYAVLHYPVRSLKRWWRARQVIKARERR